MLSLKPHDSPVNTWTGRVTSSTFLGDHLDCQIACGETTIYVRVNPFTSIEDGAEVYLYVAPERCLIIADAG
jgi:hypothetical protein